MSKPKTIKELLCEQWCADAVVAEDSAGLRISLPVYESDGDAVTVWVTPELGGWRIADNATTFMRLSYEMDLDLLDSGQRAKVLETILRESGISDDGGNLTMTVPEDELTQSLLTFGQAIARIGDIRLWNRARVASTFYDDLSEVLNSIVGEADVIADYLVPELPDAADYPIDFYVRGGSKPLYVFGIPSGDKAKLATIILQRLAATGHQFESLIVPSDITAIPQKDLRRLVNAANDMVDGLASRDALERKIHHRLLAA